MLPAWTKQFSLLRSIALALGVAWFSVVASGCSKNPDRVAISGQVLIDGQALKYGQVVFVPQGSRPSTADLDENGRFTLTSFDPHDGAALGVHQIAVYANEQLDGTRTKWHAPRKYSYYQSSGLTQEITGPRDDVVINLSWNGDPKGKPYIEVDTAPPEPSKTAIK